MASNKALVLLKAFKRHKAEGALSDPVLKRISGLDPDEIEEAATELEEAGIIQIERLYTVAKQFR